MKILRTLGVIVAVALVVIGLAVLPSMDDAPQARAGISVGESSAAGGAQAPASESATSERAAQPAGEAVALPAPTASEQPVRGIHSDTGVGTMEPVASPEPAPAPQPAAPKPRSTDSSSSSSSGSGNSSSESSSSSSGSSKSAPSRPSGVCEWDDGELECEDDDDSDDDDGSDDED